MEHRQLTDEIRENLDLYVLGLLNDNGMNEWKAHLQSGCSSCREEVHKIQSSLALLPYAQSPMQPSPELKAKLLDRVKAKTAAERVGLNLEALLESLDSVAWQPSEHPGVSTHPLKQTASDGTTVSFVKIEAGSGFPDHRHMGAEECLVLQGGFRDSCGEYKTGRYVYCDARSEQKDWHALPDEDCILFVINHRGIEML